MEFTLKIMRIGWELAEIALFWWKLWPKPDLKWPWCASNVVRPLGRLSMHSPINTHEHRRVASASSLFPCGQLVALAASGVAKLGVDVMPLAAANVSANNIMPLAAAALLAAATATATATKRATNHVRLRRCRLRHCCCGLLTQGMRLHCPKLAVRGLTNVNKG